MALVPGVQINQLITEEEKQNIAQLFNSVGPSHEFEFIFFSKQPKINREKYVGLLKYLKFLGNTSQQADQISIETTLEIVLSANKDEKYRLAVRGEDEIQALIKMLKEKNYVHRNYLVLRFAYLHNKTFNLKYNKPPYTLEIKKKDAPNVDLVDLPVRARLSVETPLTEKDIDREGLLGKVLFRTATRDELLALNIAFRLKNRTSFIVHQSSDVTVRIDLTESKTSKNIEGLSMSISNYELELEYNNKSKKQNDTQYLDLMYRESEKLIKTVQQSNFIIGLSEHESVLKYYIEQLGLKQPVRNLSSALRQPESLEIQHLSEIIDRFAVTDKADGKRFSLIVYRGSTYLISQNLAVKKTGINIDDDKVAEKYNGSILDGEYIYVPQHRCHLYMVFDCLRSGTSDVRNVSKFLERMKYAEKIINDLYVAPFNVFQFQDIPEQSSGFNVEVMASFHGKQMTRYYDWLDDHIKKQPAQPLYPLIRMKYFMPALGAKKWEIFRYSDELWRLYSADTKIKFPYILDGLIYQPLDQAYITDKRESRYSEYKLKPNNKNSLDLYIVFKRNPRTGEIINVYDNSDVGEVTVHEDVEDVSKNKLYRICTLHVGKSINDKEEPVPFDLNYGTAEAYLYLQDGEIKDEEGDIIMDHTVVEFYYNNDLTIIPQRRWVPMRTRYDKTESVEKYQKQYGNYITTAERVWRSIVNPVTMQFIAELGKGNAEGKNNFDVRMNELRSAISQEIISASKREDVYFQRREGMAKVMTQYHNFLKSNMIYTYCNKVYQTNRKQSVLDFAIGKGQDISKYYYGTADFCVGLDISADALKNPRDGAISRYKKLKNKPDAPKMYFIHADCSAKLNYEAQNRALIGMDRMNRSLLEKFFPEKGKPTIFDVVSCQFALHYFLKDRLSWNNFKSNLVRHIRAGGYFLVTTTDAHKILELIKDTNNFMVNYDENGISRPLWGIRKEFAELKYTPSGCLDVGNAIGYFAAWLFEDGNYMTEYLVDVNFLKEELEREDIVLVETDLFANQFIINSEFLLNYAGYEWVDATRDYLATKVAQYFQENDMNRRLWNNTNLYRYYVFRKRETLEPSQEGGQNIPTTDLNLKNPSFDFQNTKIFNIPNMNEYDNRYSLLSSIHKILRHHELIPSTLKLFEFLKDMDIEPYDDVEMDNDMISKICGSLKINHEIKQKRKSIVKNILDGLDIYIVSRNCDDQFDVEGYRDTNQSNQQNKRSILLMREGNLYLPMFKINNSTFQGLFDDSDPLTRYLASQN